MKQRSAYTVIELLVVLGIAAFLFSATGGLFSAGWRDACRIRREAETAQTLILIMDRWRHVLQETSPADWSATPGAFAAGPEHRVGQDARRLAFTRNGKTSHVALPAGMECAFAIDRPRGGPDLAVLTVTLKREGRKETERVRIVAAGGAPTP